MVGCCVVSLFYGGSIIFYTLGIYAGVFDDYCGMAMLKMNDNCFSAVIFFSPR